MNEEEALEILSPALDRLHEAHFWVHMQEEYYHVAEPFRWHLNVFLKAIKEVPSLVSMALQNQPGFSIWYAPHMKALKADPLLQFLFKRRDFVVHRGMLELRSKGMIGITEGRGMKLGLTFPIDPREDSDRAMDRYLYHVSKHGDFFQFLRDDEDSLPCVHREWRLPNLDGEIVDLCATAWLRTGEILVEVGRWLGLDPPQLSLECRHSGQRVKFKVYDRQSLRDRIPKVVAEFSPLDALGKGAHPDKSNSD